MGLFTFHLALSKNVLHLQSFAIENHLNKSDGLKPSDFSSL